MDPRDPLRERWQAWNSQWNYKASNVRIEESVHDCWKIIGYWSLKFRNYQSMILGMPVLQNIPLTLPYAMGIILGVFSLLISLSLFFFFFGFVLIVWGWVYISSLQLIHSKFVKAAFIWNWEIAAAAAKSLQSCPTLCSHIDGSPHGSPIPGILQARTLEWVAISFSNAWK